MVAHPPLTTRLAFSVRRLGATYGPQTTHCDYGTDGLGALQSHGDVEDVVLEELGAVDFETERRVPTRERCLRVEHHLVATAVRHRRLHQLGGHTGAANLRCRHDTADLAR